jgi:Flagellar biosynthesis protein, FliO
MPSWLEDVAGPNFAPAVLWTLLALVVLVIVLVVVRIVRSMTFGTFVAGGRNRKTRLAVMDAAAVDSQRRLVLVRRDDVEHLILIGGPTDVVVERDIRLHAATRRPGPLGEAPADQQAARPRLAEPAAQARPEQRRPAPPAARPEQRQPAPPSLPARAPAAPVNAAAVRMSPASPASQPNFSTPRPAPAAPAAPTTAAAPKPRPQDFDRPAGNINLGIEPTRKKPEMSLEEEMNRLLGELSNKR